MAVVVGGEAAVLDASQAALAGVVGRLVPRASSSSLYVGSASVSSSSRCVGKPSSPS